jgi:hypothetical protein
VERPGGPTEIIPSFRINGTKGMQSGVHGERARLACRAVRPARHTGRPHAFGTPWVAACIPRGRGIQHARRVRSPNHASLLFQPLFPVSLFLKDRVSRWREHRFSFENGIRPGGGGANGLISSAPSGAHSTWRRIPVACASGKFPQALRAIEQPRNTQSRGYTVY